MKLLLTGASGFIGKNIYENWRDTYHILAPGHSELDLTDEELVFRYLQRERPDIVIHAATTNIVAHPERTAHLAESDLRMFFSLANGAQFYDKMLYFGSGAEYDSRHYIPQMPESYFGAHIPADAYGFAKYIMARTAETSSNIFDLRLFGVFGKYEDWSRRFISNLIYFGLTGQELHMGPNMYFDYLYIQDLLPVLEWFLHHSPKYHSYNVCSGRRMELYRLGCMVCECLHLDPNLLHCAPGWKPEYTGDHTRLLEELGTELVLTPMKTAIQDLVRYYTWHKEELWPGMTTLGAAQNDFPGSKIHYEISSNCTS